MKYAIGSQVFVYYLGCLCYANVVGFDESDGYLVRICNFPSQERWIPAATLEKWQNVGV